MNIEIPYLKHKSFQNKNRFKLKNEIRFNDLYNEASIKREKTNTITLFNELDLIKKELISQVETKNEKYFLDELFEKSKIILESDLDTFKNMSVSQLRAKILSLKTLFETRNKEIELKNKKLEALKIINDSELPHAEEQLEKINKILSNENFSNNIKMIQNRIKLNSSKSCGNSP